MERADTESSPLLALEGFTIGVTADRRADEQAELLRRHGAKIVHGPSVSISPLGDEATLLAATEDVIAEPPDLVLANTAIGIRTWLAAAEAWNLDGALLDALGRARIAARGPKAAGAVQQLGLPLWKLEPTERLSAMIEGLEPEILDGAKVVLQEYGEPSVWAAEALIAAGARVTVVPVYRCTPPANREPALRLVDAAIEGRLDAVTFTSPPAVRMLFQLADDAGQAEHLRAALCRGVVVGVGPMTAETLGSVGIPRCVAPARGRLGLMVRCLTEAMSERNHRLDAGGTGVTVQGAVVACGDLRVTLSDRERAVLDILLRRPGAVVSKEVLLREVWGTEAADRKIVDSTVGRLRRRLTPAGLEIHSLPRRGYRVDAPRPAA